MNNTPKCTCSERQLNLVGCDCAVDHLDDPFVSTPTIPAHPEKSARLAHRGAIYAEARRDAEANLDNSANHAASSTDWYNYRAAWSDRAEMIDLETSAA